MAGPAIMASCIPAALKASARGSSAGGTSSGVSACWAGIWKALAVPNTTESPSSRPRCGPPNQGDNASISATSACTPTQTAATRARWWQSTTSPVTSTSASAGRNCSRPTRPRSQAEPVRSYICQPTATINIWLAPVPASRAHQKRRKSRCGSRAAGINKAVNRARYAEVLKRVKVSID